MPIKKEHQDQIDKWQKEKLDKEKAERAKDPNTFNNPAPGKNPTAI